MTLVSELSPEQEVALLLLGNALEAAPTKARPFYETATPEEWVKAWHEWTHSHDPNGAVLLDDSREGIYSLALRPGSVLVLESDPHSV